MEQRRLDAVVESAPPEVEYQTKEIGGGATATGHRLV